MVAILSVSGHGLGNCNTVLSTMKKLGIFGDVTTNLSIDPDGNVEPGCRVLIANKNCEIVARRMWETLERDYHLGCAHLKCYESKEGCIYDVFAPTKCPSAP